MEDSFNEISQHRDEKLLETRMDRVEEMFESIITHIEGDELRSYIERFKENLVFQVHQQEMDINSLSDLVRTKKSRNGRKSRVLTDDAKGLSKLTFIDTVEGAAEGDSNKFTDSLISIKDQFKVFTDNVTDDQLDKDTQILLLRMRQSFDGHLMYYLSDTAAKVNSDQSLEERKERFARSGILRTIFTSDEKLSSIILESAGDNFESQRKNIVDGAAYATALRIAHNKGMTKDEANNAAIAAVTDARKELGLEDESVKRKIKNMASRFAENVKDKIPNPFNKRTTKNFKRVATTAVLGLTLLFAKPDLNFSHSKADLKEAAKSAIVEIYEGKPNCISMAAYFEETGDLSIIPKLAQGFLSPECGSSSYLAPNLGMEDPSEIQESNFNEIFDDNSYSGDNVQNTSITSIPESVKDPPYTRVENVTPVSIEKQASVVEDIEVTNLTQTYEEEFVDSYQPNQQLIEEILSEAENQNRERVWELLSQLKIDDLRRVVTTDEVTGVVSTSFLLPEVLMQNELVVTLLGTNLTTWTNEGLPYGTVAIKIDFQANTQACLSPAVWVGNEDIAQINYRTNAKSVLESFGCNTDQILTYFYLQHQDTRNVNEPFNPTNRIAGISGTEFESGAIREDALFLTVDRTTGKWQVTDWINVPKEDENVDVSLLLWTWARNGSFDNDPGTLSSQQAAELNKILSSGNLPSNIGPSVVFRSMRSSSDMIFVSPFLFIASPELFEDVVTETPISGQKPDNSLYAGSPDLHYTSNGRFPVLNSQGYISAPGNSDDLAIELFSSVNNPISFSISLTD